MSTQAKLKTELAEYGRKLKLIWYLRNDERPEEIQTELTLNPRNNDVVIETYLSCLEESLIDIDVPSKIFNNLNKEEGNATYSLKMINQRC